MDLRSLQTLSQRERWQDTWQTFRHHRLAAARWTYHDDIVTTRSRYLQCTLHTLLAFHISKIKVEIILVFIKLLAGINKRRLMMRITIQETDDVRKVIHTIDIEIIDDSSLTDILARHQKSFELLFTGTDSNRKDTTDGLELSIETQFSYHHIFT